MKIKNKKALWMAWPVKNYRITLLMTALVFVFGLIALTLMPKDEFPPFTIRQGLVAAVYPGATSEEVEAQVARPLERYLFTFKEVKRAKTTTTSTGGMCICLVELNDDVYDQPVVWNRIKHGLNTFKQNLPQGVVALVCNDDFGATCALLISVESEQRSYRELQKYSDDLADRLRRVPSVANVNQYGNVKQQISLYVDRDRLSAYGIGQMAIMQALTAQGLTTMSGSVTSGRQNTTIHLAPTDQSEEEIGNQIVYTDAQNHVVRVKDIAEVRREYDLSEKYIMQDGHNCVLLSLEMNEGNNIVQYGREVDEVLKDFRQNYLPADVHTTRITDMPQVVGDSVKDFLINLIESMVIIILVMMILFPLRSAIVAAITIPLSTFTSIGIMYAVGIPLNIITLASLIIVLGMIVDNSIVVIDGYLEYFGRGMERRRAAVLSASKYFMPMMLATVCICVIFFPLLYTMTGDAGDVIKSFPATITINLMVSLVVAVAIIPLLNSSIITKIAKRAEGKKGITDYVQDAYLVCLKWCFKHPWGTIVGGFALSLLSLGIFTQLKMRQFPFADRNQFAVEIFLPEGSGIDETRRVAEELRDSLQRDPRVTGITSFIGCSSPRFQISYAPQVGGKNFAQFIVNTPDNQTTLDLLRQYGHLSNHWPKAYCKFKRMDFLNVPTYEYRFYGDDLDSLQCAADQLMAHMRLMPELEWVHTDNDQPHPIIDVSLDPVASAQQGVNRTTAALQLMAATGDLTVGSAWEGDYELPIVVKDTASDRLTASEVENLYMTNLTGKATPLRQVANIGPRWTQTKINHRGGLRCLSVLAEGKQGVLATPVQNRIEKILSDSIQLPRGVESEVGGEVEKNGEMIPQIALGIGLSLVIIFFFLLFNFKKFGLTTVCMVSIALLLPGSMLGLWIANRTLGLTSLFGFITLMGIIMRNEILIFEHAEDLVRQGWTPHDAAFDAGRRRMVPIFLTTATTAVGVIPMIIAGSSFWMPVGVTIFAGGIGTLLLVVTVLPVAYWKLTDNRRHLLRYATTEDEENERVDYSPEEE